MPRDISGYEYVNQVPIDDLCGLLDDEDSPLNKWLTDAGIDYTTADISCAAIGIAGAAAGGAGFVVAGVYCGVTVLGCAANDAIRNNTPCGTQYVDIYIEKHSSTPTILFLVSCENDVIDEAEDVARDIGNDLQNRASNAYDISVEVGSDIADGFTHNTDVVDDAVDDIIDMGSSIL